MRRLGIYALVVLAAFLIGIVPMWLVARSRANERDVARQELRVTQLENALAATAILARRGDYEPARAAASSFYTALRTSLDDGHAAFSVPQRELMQSLIAQRDQVITLLARGDPAVAGRLGDAYVSYRETSGTLPRPVVETR
jgi:hypothetical protein